MLILGFANLLLSLSGLPWRLERPAAILPFLLLCGASWEVLPLFYKAGAVFDWFDFLAYLAGGALFVGLKRLSCVKGDGQIGSHTLS